MPVNAFAPGGTTASNRVETVRRVVVAAAVLMVCLTISIPRDTLFSVGIPLGPGSLKVTDLLLAVAFGGWLWLLHTGARTRLPARPLIAGIACLVIAGVAGLITAAARGNDLQLALLEFRPLLAYLLVLPLVGCFEHRDARAAITALAVSIVAASAVIIGLYAAGKGEEAQFADGATRVEAVPVTVSLLGVVVGLALLPHLRSRRASLMSLAIAGIAFIALYFTFHRGAWLGAIAAVAVAVAVAPSERRLRLVATLAVAALVVALGVSGVNAVARSGTQNPLASGAERLGSVFRAGDDISSQHRVNEWREARRQIERRPFTGIGLGGSITFFSPLYDPVTNRMGRSETNIYIHNSYIWAALKMGVAGGLVLIALLAGVFVAAARAARGATGSARAALAVGLAVLTSLLVISLTGPHLTVESSTALLAAVIAGLELARRTHRTSPPAGSEA